LVALSGTEEGATGRSAGGGEWKAG
jgi:hypothetical protein